MLQNRNFKLHSAVFQRDTAYVQIRHTKIAHDFGKALNSGGTLIALRRTKSGEQAITEAKTVDEWIAIIQATAV